MIVIRWKDIPEFPGYQVSDSGEVRSQRGCARRPDGKRGTVGILTGKWHSLRGRVNKQGYLYFVIRRDGKPHTRKAHRLVLEAFVGPCPPGFWACHNNGISLDNRLENLRWDTPRSNYDDAIKHGSARGVNNGRVKLTPDGVREIRRLHSEGHTFKELGAIFGVSGTNIRDIVLRKRWSHIE